ncbi:MAG: hypothetical protein GY909_16310 [Oligoflexia bacterium]|nr:hypothetical protein [Oligoflexia bacterium]
MKKIAIITLGFALLSSSAFARKFKCSYYETHKVKSGRKVKVKSQKVLDIRVNLDKFDGGKVKIKSSYLFGDKSFQKFNFYRVDRKNEKAFSYAKFHNKTPKQSADKEWIPTYMRFSLPKKAFGKKKPRSFTAYFGYFRSQTNFDSIDGSLKGVTLSEDERQSFKSNNVNELEYKMTCK